MSLKHIETLVLNIENFSYDKETQKKPAAGGGGAVQHDEKLFFYLSIGLGILAGLLLILLLVSVLFHRLDLLNLQTCPHSDNLSI